MACAACLFFLRSTPRDEPPPNVGAAAASATTTSSGPITSSTPKKKKSTAPPPARPPLYAELDHHLDREAANRRCEGCHEPIAKEWRASLHRDAYVDPSFTEAFAAEPRAFCRNCHAPESNPKTPLVAGLVPVKLTGFGAESGTSCVTCHLPRAGETAATLAHAPVGHPPLRVASLSASEYGGASEGGCGDCHQFTFPDQSVRTKVEWMQLTLLEHEDSLASTSTCGGCHMPLVLDDSGKQHASHRFDASRDPAFVKGAAKIVAVRNGEDVTLTLTLGSVGHAFPTGDLLRRLALVVVAGDPAMPHVKRVKYLGRHFADVQQVPGIIVRVVKTDDRLGVEGEESRAVTLRLPGSSGQPMHWRVLYQRVQHLGGGENDAKISGEIVVDEGDLAEK